MARKPTGGPVGRPEKDIDWALFEQLCAIQCTQEEMAGLLKIHRDTLSDRAKQNYGEEYSTVYKKMSEGGKCSLRRNQFAMSKTNASMAIWLGKQYLGQKDIQEQMQVTTEALTQYKAILDQMAKLQQSASALKIDDTSKSTESKS